MSFVLIPFLLLFSILETGNAPQLQTPAAKYFIVIFSLGPQWDHKKPANEQTGMSEHSANLQKLRKDGTIAIGARYSDKGMIIIKADSIDSARGLFSSDPMVKADVFTMEVHEWKPFYKGIVE